MPLLKSSASIRSRLKSGGVASTSDGTSLASKRVVMRGEPRVVYVNVLPPADKLDERGRNFIHYADNRIRTTKYTVLSFVPKNLFEQFRRLANFYFLALVVLQSFPVFEVADPIYAAMPIATIVLITAAKDVLEDWKRRRSDAEINHSPCLLLANVDNMNYIGAELPLWRRVWYNIRTLPQIVARAIAHQQEQRRRRKQAEERARKRAAAAAAAAHDSAAANRQQADRAATPELAMVDMATQSPLSLSRPKSIKSAAPPASPAPSSWDHNNNNARGPLDTTAPHWTESQWKRLRVGDFVYLKNDETVPADIVILSTSEADGVCYVETKNLDGETNLKLRSGFAATSHITTPDDCSRLQCELHAEPPNNHLYTFKGMLVLFKEQTPDEEIVLSAGTEKKQEPERPPPQTLPIGVNELLLRGCILRNTQWVIGVVVYTGGDAKLMMNSGVTPSKRSMIERQMNPQILISFALTFIICVVLAICNGLFEAQFKGLRAPFIPETFSTAETSQSAFETAFLTFWSSLILIQNIIPISLYVTAEVVKTAQSYFIHSDIDMYFEEYDAPCVPKTWTIADDLGQIEYIFSDKTGTLTRNVMDFRKCSINGVSYGGYHEQSDNESVVSSNVQSSVAVSTNPTVDSSPNKPQFVNRRSSKSSMVDKMTQFYKNPYMSDKVTFVDEQFAKDLFDDKREQSKVIKEFFTHLAVCHTVLSEYPDDQDDFSIVYKAQSPDEAALVTTAKDVGFAFIDRLGNELTVNILDTLVKFEILDIIEFTSTRKRMSVLVKTANGTILLYCKGADSIIYERLSAEQTDLKQKTLEHLESYATEGLRTLCLSYKLISPSDYEAWSAEYQAAMSDMNDRETAMDRVADKIERNMTLLGATAIEDRLQDGVPECIARLANGGIKIWVLTGDKMETAINIGFSCNLLRREMVLVVIKGTDLMSTRLQLNEALTKCFGVDPTTLEEKVDPAEHFNADSTATKDSGSTVPHQPAEFLSHATDAQTDDGRPQVFALIIDGHSLKYALDKSCKRRFVELACLCKAVICCRVSPLQKAQVVGVVKQLKAAMTLAIGDGANDVSMIQQAHIGVGIQGKEGMQAVMASDFAVAQFRYLNRLLLVHGRWSYFRTAEMVLLMFYKNMVWTLVLVWFQFHCGFSAQILYDYSFVLLYNLIYTSLPPVMVGVFDQDIRDQYSLAVPQVYRRGIRRELYGTRHFLLYVLDGIYQSLVIYFVAYWAVGGDTFISADGLDVGMLELGTLAAALGICNANFYAGLNSYHWTWMVHLGVWGSPALFFLVTILYSYMTDSTVLGITMLLFAQPVFWLAMPVGVMLCLMPRFIVKFVRCWRFPNDIDLLREIQKFKLDEWQYIHTDLEGLDLSPSAMATIQGANPQQQQQQPPSDDIEMADMTPLPPPSSSTPPPTTTPFITLLPSPSAQAIAHRINAEFDRVIASPLRKGFESFNTDLKRATSVLFMKTGATRTNTGFAFSQEPGVAAHLSKLASPTVGTFRRRQGHFQSAERLGAGTSPNMDAGMSPGGSVPIPGSSETPLASPSRWFRLDVAASLDGASGSSSSAAGQTSSAMSPPYWTPPTLEVPPSGHRPPSRFFERTASPLVRHSITAADTASIASGTGGSITPDPRSPTDHQPYSNDDSGTHHDRPEDTGND